MRSNALKHFDCKGDPGRGSTVFSRTRFGLVFLAAVWGLTGCADLSSQPNTAAGSDRDRQTGPASFRTPSAGVPDGRRYEQCRWLETAHAFAQMSWDYVQFARQRDAASLPAAGPAETAVAGNAIEAAAVQRWYSRRLPTPTPTAEPTFSNETDRCVYFTQRRLFQLSSELLRKNDYELKRAGTDLYALAGFMSNSDWEAARAVPPQMENRVKTCVVYPEDRAVANESLLDRIEALAENYAAEIRSHSGGQFTPSPRFRFWNRFERR